MTGLRFREVMVGALAPQETDAAYGYESSGALVATLNAHVDIRDLRLFLDRDTAHVGGLGVELSIPVLGSRPFVAHDGRFELFKAGEIQDGGNGRLMVYDATVTDGERTYSMTGRKYLHPRRLWRAWRLWPETTTLFVTLKDITAVSPDGSVRTVQIPVSDPLPSWLEEIQRNDEPQSKRDYDRPTYFAGQVRLSPAAFIDEMLSMRAVRTPWYARLFVRLRFMGFFAGTLVKIYVVKWGGDAAG